VNVFYVSIRTTENYEFDKIRTAGVIGNATIKTSRAIIPYVQPEMKFRSPPGQFHHEPPLFVRLQTTVASFFYILKCKLSYVNHGVPGFPAPGDKVSLGAPTPARSWQHRCEEWVGSERTSKADSGPAALRLVSRPVWKLHVTVTSQNWRQNCEAHSQEYWASWLLTMFLHSLASFSVGLLRSKFSSFWLHGRGKYNTNSYRKFVGS